MSKKSNQTVRIVFGVAVAIALLYGLAEAFDLKTRWKLHRALSQLESGRGGREARETLKNLDRQTVIEALKSSLDSEGTIAGKVSVLNLLSEFRERRAVLRAADSKVLATRRASILLRADAAKNDPALADTLIAWLKDSDADMRGRAAMQLARFGFKEAEPVLIEMIGEKPAEGSDTMVVRACLVALRQFKTKGISDKLIALFADNSLDDGLRAEALDTLSRLDEAKRETVLEHALEIIQDTNNSRTLRAKMTTILRRPSWGSERVWSALEKIVLDQNDDDWITQRTCLAALSVSAPLDRVRNLILDKRVYRHPYFGIRIDVATGLNALNVREEIAVQILGELLIDEDKKDTQSMVRSEALLTLWSLTGVANGVGEKELFRRPPPPIRDPERAREFFIRASFLRPGVSQEQANAARAAVTNIAEAKKIREIYIAPRSLQSFREAWDAQKRATEEREKELERKKRENAPGDVGPVPPKDGG